MNSHPINLDLIVEVFDKDRNKIKEILNQSEIEGKDTIELTKLDNNGNETEKLIVPMKSFVRNFLSYYNKFSYNQYHMDFTETNGDNANGQIGQIIYAMVVDGPLDDDSYGICIGTGSSPISASNYKLNYKIPKTMVSYSPVTFESASAYGNGYKFEIQRIFSNLTSNDINISETGLLFKEYNVIGTLNKTGLMIHDIMSSGSQPINFIVSSSQTVRVVYNIFIDGTSGLTYNFINMLYGILSRKPIPPLKSVYYNGTTILERQYNLSVNENHRSFLTNAPAGNSIYGIVVGSGTSSFNINDYKLESKYEHGTTTNTLEYGLMSYSSSYNETGSMAIQTRTFVNKSGAPITIREAGLYAWGTSSANTPPINSPASSYICIARKLTGDIVLEDQQSVNISFVFNTSTE